MKVSLHRALDQVKVPKCSYENRLRKFLPTFTVLTGGPIAWKPEGAHVSECTFH